MARTITTLVNYAFETAATRQEVEIRKYSAHNGTFTSVGYGMPFILYKHDLYLKPQTAISSPTRSNKRQHSAIASAENRGPSLMSKAQALGYAKVMDMFNAGVKARELLINDPNWRTLFMCQKRHLVFLGPLNPTQLVDSAPCHSCGILLPLDSLHFDHHQPRNPDPGKEDMAVIKTFRALGLTKATSTGSRASSFGVGTGLLSQIEPRGKNREKPFDKDKPTPEAKWATNDQGDYLLSIIMAAKAAVSNHSIDQDPRNDLRRICLNSVLNIAPLCPLCNSRKENSTRVIKAE